MPAGRVDVPLVYIEPSERLNDLRNRHRTANLLEQERQPVPKETTAKPSAM
jgi:hypothetical protein